MYEGILLVSRRARDVAKEGAKSGAKINSSKLAREFIIKQFPDMATSDKYEVYKLMKKIKAFGICLYKTFNGRHVEILLCKSVQSKTKWGLLKGVQENGETDIQTAIREFSEESSIQIDKSDLGKYFEQQNKSKDIGIWLVNDDTIHIYNNFF